MKNKIIRFSLSIPMHWNDDLYVLSRADGGTGKNAQIKKAISLYLSGRSSDTLNQLEKENR